MTENVHDVYRGMFLREADDWEQLRHYAERVGASDIVERATKSRLRLLKMAESAKRQARDERAKGAPDSTIAGPQGAF